MRACLHSRTSWRIVSLAIVILALTGPIGQQTSQAADAFERVIGSDLRKLHSDVKPVPSLTMDDTMRLKPISRTLSNPLVILRTNDGNLVKALIAWGFHRKEGTQELTPVLLLERFVTYRTDRENVTAAAGREVMLFAGFAFNFDIGQVVPEGHGADITLTAEGKLLPVGSAEILPLNGLPESSDPDEKRQPEDHSGILPQDYTGNWDVTIDGRWRGDWNLTVGENGLAEGRYRSDETQSVYNISGRSTTPYQRIRLVIHLENADQVVNGYLWSTDKSTMAGTVELAGRTFGFYAVRKPTE